MEQHDKHATESETIRLIAVEEVKQRHELSFKAMLDLFYMNVAPPMMEEELRLAERRAQRAARD